MAYSEQHLRLTFGGTLGPEETWTTGLRFRPPTVPGETDLEDVAMRFYGFLTDTSVQMCQYVRFTWAKLAVVGTDGRYPEGVEAILWEPESPLGGTGGTNMPPQVTLAVTLETGVSRGRASRGRMYLPPTSLFPGTDGRLTVAQAENVAVAAASMLDDVTDLMGAPVLVMSNIGQGVSRSVEAVSVGRVLDTQRRRRRSIDELRTSRLINP